MPKQKELKGRKRKKNYYVQFQKKPRLNTLEPGSQGFLLTCNNDERRCIREAYNILNEFVDPVLLDNKKEGKDDSPSPPPCQQKQDVEDDLEEELKSLREGDLPGQQQKRHFHQVYTGIKSCLFIRTELEPCPILLRILEAIQTSGKQRTISTQKIFPVLGSCKAHLDNLRRTLTEVMDRVQQQKDLYSADRKLQYAVLFRARHNDTLKKEQVVTTVIDTVRSQGIPWEPEPRTPDCAISIDVLSSVCCISVLPLYKKYKRYNLVEVAKAEDVLNTPDTDTTAKIDSEAVDRTDETSSEMTLAPAGGDDASQGSKGTFAMDTEKVDSKIEENSAAPSEAEEETLPLTRET